jgi:YwiC-like protein
VFPREHGAYGQLLFPLATVLIVGRRTPSALLLAAAAVLAFLAHEPLLVLLGRRGPRAARDDRRRALEWFVWTAAGAAILGAAAFVEAPPGIALAPAASLPAALACLLAIAIYVDREHTPAGEALAAIALPSIALPVARAATVESTVALTCAAVFAAAFVAATLSVHAVIARTRKPPAAGERIAGAAAAAGSIAALAVLAALNLVSVVAPIAALPICLVALIVALAAPSARRLRAIGWTLIATTLLAAALLIVAFG